MKACKLAVFVLSALILPFVQNASADVFDTFDSDAAGWNYYHVPDTTFGEVQYNTIHETIEAGIDVIDQLTGHWHFMSPGTLLDPYGGDWSSLYGGTISFDLFVDDLSISGNTITNPPVGILLDVEGPRLDDTEPTGTFYSAAFTVTQVNTWLHFEIDILDSVFEAGWNTAEPNLSNNLDQVYRILIFGNWLTGDERVELDNVRISSPIPVPGTLVLMFSGLLGVAARFRKKQT